MPLQLRANIDVPSLEEGIRFYTGVFELTVTRRLGDGFAELSGGSFVIDLLVKSPGTAPFPGALATRDYARHWTPVHLDFCVEDLDATLQRALAAGAVVQAEPRDAAFGRIALLSDPFGHGLCLLQLSEQGYDAIPGMVRPL